MAPSGSTGAAIKLDNKNIECIAVAAATAAFDGDDVANRQGETGGLTGAGVALTLTGDGDNIAGTIMTASQAKGCKGATTTDKDGAQGVAA